MFPWIMFPSPNAVLFVPSILFYFPITLLSEPLMRFFPEVTLSSFGVALMFTKGWFTLVLGGVGLMLGLTGLGLTLGLVGYWGPEGFGKTTELTWANRAKNAVRAINFIFD